MNSHDCLFHRDSDNTYNKYFQYQNYLTFIFHYHHRLYKTVKLLNLNPIYKFKIQIEIHYVKLTYE